MKKVLTLLLSAVMTLTLFAGFTFASEPVEDGPVTIYAGPDNGETRQTPADTFTLGVSVEPTSLEPCETQSISGTLCTLAVYDTLIKMDENGNYEGVLAESWEYVDESTLVFKIKSGVKFHNGTDLTADDVLFTFERLANSSRYATNFGCIDFENTKVVDDTTIEVKLLTSYAPLLSFIAYDTAAILSRAYYEEAGEEGLARRPMGTGAFIFDEWVSGDRFVAHRNEEYWGEKPAFENYVVRFITEPNTRMIEFETGGIDAAIDLSASEISAMKNGYVGNASMYQLAGEYVTRVCMLDTDGPFADERVRKAIAAGIDWQGTVFVAYGETANFADELLPLDCKFYTEAPGYEYNPEAAKALLAEAGYADGFTIKTAIAAGSNDAKAIEILQAQLAEYGITLDIESTDQMTAIQRMLNAEIDFAVIGGTCTIKDPDQILSNMKMNSPFQIAVVHDETLNGYLVEGATNADEAVRAECYANACSYVYEHVNTIPMAVSVVSFGVRDYIDNFPCNAGGLIDIKAVTFK